MFKEEGYKLMGAAFEVYNESGYGMAEEIYQQSLEIELGLREIPFRSKPELTVFYKDRQLDTRYKPDLLVYGGIVVELKATRQLTDVHFAVVRSYLRAVGREHGLILNFAKPTLEAKRVRLRGPLP